MKRQSSVKISNKIVPRTVDDTEFSLDLENEAGDETDPFDRLPSV